MPPIGKTTKSGKLNLCWPDLIYTGRSRKYAAINLAIVELSIKTEQCECVVGEVFASGTKYFPKYARVPPNFSI
jgi:hypothetical protein